MIFVNNISLRGLLSFFLIVQLRLLFTAMFVPLLLKSPNICKDKIELDEHIFVSLQQLDTGSVDPSKLSELSFDLRDIVNPTVQDGAKKFIPFISTLLFENWKMQ